MNSNNLKHLNNDDNLHSRSTPIHLMNLFDLFGELHGKCVFRNNK